MLASGAALGLALPDRSGPVYLGLWAGQVLALWLPNHDHAWILVGLISTGIGSLLGLVGYLAGIVAGRGWREARQGSHLAPESAGTAVEARWSIRLRTWLLRASWLPAALWFGSLMCIAPNDRWCVVAVAPLLVTSIGLSFSLGVAGGLLFCWKATRREFDPLLAACSLLAGSVFFLT